MTMPRLLILVPLLLAGALGAQEPRRPKLDREADPNDWRSYYMAGVKQLTVSPARSAEYFLWASRLSPSSAEPLHARWVARLLANPRLLEEAPGRGSPEEAALLQIDSLLFRAFEIDPFTPRQLSRMVYDAMPGQYGNDRFTNGVLAYTEGRYDLARSHLRHLLNGSAARDARYYRALSWQAQQQFDSAAAELEALAELARTDNARAFRRIYESPAIYELGVGAARIRLRDYPGARAALQRALEEDVSLAAAHFMLSQLAQLEGDTAQRVNEARMAAELQPGSAAMHDAYATALRAAGQLEAAAAEYERAIALEPHWAAPHYNVALVLEQLDRRADAARHYGEFVARAPRAYEQQRQVAEERRRVLAGP